MTGEFFLCFFNHLYFYFDRANLQRFCFLIVKNVSEDSTQKYAEKFSQPLNKYCETKQFPDIRVTLFIFQFVNEKRQSLYIFKKKVAVILNRAK